VVNFFIYGAEEGHFSVPGLIITGGLSKDIATAKLASFHGIVSSMGRVLELEKVLLHEASDAVKHQASKGDPSNKPRL
jgi:hypothetical protein